MADQDGLGTDDVSDEVASVRHILPLGQVALKRLGWRFVCDLPPHEKFYGILKCKGRIFICTDCGLYELDGDDLRLVKIDWEAMNGR